MFSTNDECNIVAIGCAVEIQRGRGLAAEGEDPKPGAQGILCHRQEWPVQRLSRCQRGR